MVRLQPDLLAWVDAERAKLDPEPSRPEFIRQVLDEHKLITDSILDKEGN